MFNNKSIFITGANRGIGLELVKESLNKDFFVFGTFRNKLKSKKVFEITSSNINLFEMNVIDEISISSVSNQLNKPIDYLVCNAGINNGFGSSNLTPFFIDIAFNVLLTMNSIVRRMQRTKIKIAKTISVETEPAVGAWTDGTAVDATTTGSGT